MTEFSLVGDIGGTNSRFGLVQQGSMAIEHMEALRNDNFASLEAAIQQYLRNRNVTALSSAAIAVAAPVDREQISLTNRDWSFTSESLRQGTASAIIERLRSPGPLLAAPGR
jgi:glucokinase